MNPAAYPAEHVTGVVLAGGRGRRMGGEDKGLVGIAGRPMVLQVIERLRPQVGALLISANRNRTRYEEMTGCRVVADRHPDYAGPLAGMASAMEAAGTRFILTSPCDAPLVPGDLGPRLYRALADEGSELSVVHDGERVQPVFALLDRVLLGSMIAYLDSGERKIDRWYARHRMAKADFSGPAWSFVNVNSPEDRIAIERAFGEEGRRAGECASPGPRTGPGSSSAAVRPRVAGPR